MTESERYLQRLCERSFLTLWSYAGVFRDQGHRGGDGKEITDLLVVFENHVIIFSDKDIKFPDTGDLTVDWKRWYSKAVVDGTKQVWGAERWLREHPDRVFLDRRCTQPFPFPLPAADRAIYHRIVVAHGASARCRKELQGSGSLMLMPYLGNTSEMPFTIGDLDPTRGYIHVLDDTTLEAVMTNCDTITDFVAYLTKKEQLIRSGKLVSAGGEEDLLAFYLKHLGEDGGHDFAIPADATGFVLMEGDYEEYLTNPQRLRKLEADRISYAWDRLIELFSGNVLRGTLHDPDDPRVEYHEQGLRLLAREPRVRRRMLASAFVGLIEQPREGLLGARVLEPSHPGDPYYVFLVLAQPERASYEEYRQVRRHLLLEYSRVVRLLHPNADTVVGLATEPIGVEHSSEDLTVYDGTQFDEAERKAAEEAREAYGILRNVRRWGTVEKEYPDEQPSAPRAMPKKGGRFPGTGRNDPCPCGRGRKYKKCCGP